MIKTNSKKLGLRKILITLAALVTIITGGKLIYAWFVGGVDVNEFYIFIRDQDGYPRIDIAIETPNGPRYPDAHGKIIARQNWIDQIITIHDVKTWRLLGRQKITRCENERFVELIITKRFEVIE